MQPGADMAFWRGVLDMVWKGKVRGIMDNGHGIERIFCICSCSGVNKIFNDYNMLWVVLQFCNKEM